VLDSTPSSSLRVEPISQATQRPALDYLARSPYLNVFISHVLLHDSAQAVRKNVVVVSGERGIVGVAYYGRQIVIAAEPIAVAPLAAYLLRYSGNRMIVGPRDAVRDFGRFAGDRLGRPRLFRDRQLVMMVDRPTGASPFRPSRHGPSCEDRRLACGRRELGFDDTRGTGVRPAAVTRPPST